MKNQIKRLLTVFTILIVAGCGLPELNDGKDLVKSGDLEGAEAKFLEAMKIDGQENNALVPYHLAIDIYLKQRRYDEMNAMIEEALKRNPDQKVGGKSIIDEINSHRQTQWLIEYNSGVSLYTEANLGVEGNNFTDDQIALLQQAKKHFSDAISVYPEDEGSYGNLIHVLRSIGDVEGEENAIKMTLERFPNNLDVTNLGGDLMTSQGRPEEAIKYYLRAHAIDSKDMFAIKRVASTYLELDQQDKALEMMISARVDFPLDLDILFNIAMIYTNMADKNSADAQNDYRDALQDSQGVNYELLESAIEMFNKAQEQYAEALYFLESTLSINADDADVEGLVTQITGIKRQLINFQASAEEILEKRK